ncbi:MAG: hypothetical protein GWO85_00395 [Simkaniaceae bacterium]|nr:hypothetical protein [Simkaniaceae bacterium]
MSREIKSGIGYIIPTGALIGYAVALFSGLYLISIIFAVAGILGWFLYALVMEIKLPGTMGNMIIAFSVLIGIGIFMTYGMEQDIFGGYMFKVEGTIFSLLVILFGVIGGVLFNRSREKTPFDLSPEDKELVKSALQKAEGDGQEPRVIVVKQEVERKEDEEGDEEEDPRYMPGYPPEGYYYDDEDEYDDDEDYEDEEDEWDEEEDEE